MLHFISPFLKLTSNLLAEKNYNFWTQDCHGNPAFKFTCPSRVHHVYISLHFITRTNCRNTLHSPTVFDPSWSVPRKSVVRFPLMQFWLSIRRSQICPERFAFWEEFSHIWLNKTVQRLSRDIPDIVVRLNETNFVDTFSINLQISNSMKIHPVGARTERRADRQTWRS